MAYQVLARKYRPQDFEQLRAQEHISKILANAIKMKRIAHAYLFSGPRGVGKTSLARIFAKSLNCVEGMTITPCNKCPNCLQINNSTSYDVTEIDGASNTGVDDVRELQRELMFSSNSSRYKIYIIDEVHMLSKNAFNALLKTLEEPPKNVIFIFATTEPFKVLPTIISRCQRYEFKRIPDKDIVELLKDVCQKENIKYESGSLMQIAKKADGSLRDALSNLDQVIAFSGNKINLKEVQFIFSLLDIGIFIDILGYIIKDDMNSLLILFKEIVEQGNDINNLVSGLLDFVMDLLVLKFGIKPDFVSDEILQQMNNLTQKIDENTLLYMGDIIIKTKNDLRYSDNQLLLCEMMFMKLFKSPQIKSVDKILLYIKGKLTNTKSEEIFIPTSNQTPEKTINNLKNDNKVNFSKKAFYKKKDVFLNKLDTLDNLLSKIIAKSILIPELPTTLKISVDSKISMNKVLKNKKTIQKVLETIFYDKIDIQLNYSKKGKVKKDRIKIGDLKKDSELLAKLVSKLNGSAYKIEQS